MTTAQALRTAMTTRPTMARLYRNFLNDDAAFKHLMQINGIEAPLPAPVPKPSPSFFEPLPMIVIDGLVTPEALTVKYELTVEQRGECATRRWRVEAIKRAVCSVSGLPWARICSQNRQIPVALARHAAMYLLHEFIPENSLSMIGRQVGNRDHTTVLHGLRKVKASLEAEGEASPFHEYIWPAMTEMAAQ